MKPLSLKLKIVLIAFSILMSHDHVRAQWRRLGESPKGQPEKAEKEPLSHGRARNIHEAVEDGNLRAVESFLERDPSCVKAKDNNGFLPLHLSTTKDIAQLLLSHGADLEARGYEKRTPLLQAAMRGRTEVVEYLLSKGANVNAVDSNGQTSLLIAIGPRGSDFGNKTSRETVKALLTNGADVNFGEGKKGTALHRSVSYDRKDLAELLLDQRANINAKDQYGNTPLHKAVSQKNKDLVKLLVERGANVNARNSQRRTPLYDTWGGSAVDKEIAEILISHGGVK